MRITRVEIENFRSIEKLTLDTDKPLIVLEGGNDTGKSNIILAIDVALRNAAHQLLPPVGQRSELEARVAEVQNSISPQWPRGLPTQNLVRHGSNTARVRVEIDAPERRGFGGGKEPLAIEVEIAEQPPTGPARVRLVSPALDAVSPEKIQKHMGARFDEYLELASLVGRAFRHVPTHRVFEQELYQPDQLKLQWDGKAIKRLLFSYKNHESREVQGRFEMFRRACAAETLPIGDVFVGNTSRGGSSSVLFARTERDGLTLDLEDRSSGVQQLTFLLGLCICHQSSVLAIEEPELNLSEALQEKLWETLRALVPAGTLDQIWITSHSEFFKRWADRVIVTRTAETGTEATPAPMRKGPTGVPFTEPLIVSNTGNLNISGLTMETKDVLGLTSIPHTGTLVYLQRDQNRLELMSDHEFLRRNPEDSGET